MDENNSLIYEEKHDVQKNKGVKGFFLKRWKWQDYLKWIALIILVRLVFMIVSSCATN